MSDFNFNVFDEKYEPGFDLIPNGTYTAVIRKCEVRDSKKCATDKNLYIEFSVIDNGPYKNRIVFEYISIHHSSEEWEGKQRARLRSLAEAAGIADPKGPRDFVNRNVAIEVVIEKNSGFQPKNKASSFKPIVKQEIPSLLPSADNNAPAPADEFGDDVPF